jgi:parallel beta-helix repeat protein
MLSGAAGLIVLLGTSSLFAQPPSCPQPTVAEGESCVLQEDLTLSEPFVLAANTTLDCKGHALSPSKTGEPAEPTAATVGNYKASVPEVAIFLNNVTGAVVRNCSIEGFDFGIVIVRNKAASDQHGLGRIQNRILSNDISVRAHGILLVDSDANLLSGNTIHWSSGGGQGITLYRSSNRNRISDNEVISAGNPFEFAPPAPGFLNSSARWANPDDGIFILEPGFPADAALLNLRVGGTFLQFPSAVGSSAEGNIVENNYVSLPGPLGDKDHRGISAGSRAAHNVFRGNTVSGGNFGLSTAGDASGRTFLAGSCSSDSTRRCISNADCFLPGVDTESLGTCSGTTFQADDLRSRENVLEGNRLLAPFNTGGILLGLSFGTVAQGNTIVGDGLTSGIVVGGPALASATITRNVITGAKNGLQIGVVNAVSPPAKYGAKIYLNDITGSASQAILVINSPPFSVQSDLSVLGQGNYWGHTCEEGGYLPSDTTLPSFVTDSHPYGQPVAEMPDPLPAPCR